MYESLIARHRDGAPQWMKDTPAYLKLYVLHQILEGKFYDVLEYGFHEETKGDDEYIPMHERRPLVRFNMARMTALKVGRKMFAGRQKPAFRSKSTKAAVSADLLAREGLFYPHMKRAAFWGSVGATCVSFSFGKDGAGNVRLVFCTHPAYECQPVFDGLGELISLRVNRLTSGAALIDTGRVVSTDGPVDPSKQYWHVCLHDTQHVIDYVPIPKDDYAPTKRDTWPMLHEDKDRSSTHGLGFVPAHWFADLELGTLPWGGCYWDTMMPNQMASEYTMSQGLRGQWYSAAPQLVVMGELKNQSYGGNGKMVHRGPANVLQFDTTRKGAANESIEGGSAALLEASGAGFSENRESTELLRKFSLEETQTSRKDPDRMRTSGMSGAAMENMDEDFVDLMQDQRDIYCDGAITLMKKAQRAGVRMKHRACAGLTELEIGSLDYQFPQPYPIGSHEALEYAQAFRAAIGQPETPAGPAGPDGKPGKPGAPAEEPFLEPEQAATMFQQLLNIPQIEPEPSRQQAPVVDEPEITGES